MPLTPYITTPESMDSEFKIDARLVEETIRGRREAYDELFVRYSSQVQAMLTVRCLGNESQAKDITQEAFIKAFVNIEKFDPQYTFGQWIYTIARNLFIDYTRRRRSESCEVDHEIPCYQPNPEQRVINSQNNRRIEEALHRLPIHYQKVFELRYMQDISYEEIAQELNLPLGTVKTQIHRARERFMRELGIISFD